MRKYFTPSWLGARIPASGILPLVPALQVLVRKVQEDLTLCPGGGPIEISPAVTDAELSQDGYSAGFLNVFLGEDIICLFVYFTFIYRSIHLFIFAIFHLFIHSSIHLFVYAPIHLFTHSFIHLFIYSPIHHFGEGILWHFSPPNPFF